MEVRELTRLLERNRLITLIGPGGTGKTSLAIALAEKSADQFADGAVFVPLESVSTPDLVASAIVAGLGLRDVTGSPARERLLDNLSDRELLLVIDNFEHVLEAASLVGDLLGAGPSLKVVTTSRAPLHLRGEQAFPVSPLPVPTTGEPIDAAGISLIDSVRLFVDRARRVLPGFELGHDNAVAVADTCRLLDGLPLGIELAVSRISVLGPAGIRDRLARQMSLPGTSVRGAPARHRTLQDAIAWSHDLLDEPSRRLFRQLSVFAGGCRLEELEAVCQPLAEPGRDVVESLASLVDLSLVIANQRAGEVRYDMLRTIRDFAAERRAAAPERDEVERRHAQVYAAFAEQAAPRLGTRGQTAAFHQLASDRDNLRAATRWSIDHAVPEVGLRLAAALARFWGMAGELDEGRRTVAAVLAIPGADARTTWLMRALEGSGLIYYYTADNEQAAAAYRQQLAVAHELNDRKGETDARFNLLYTEDYRGRVAEGLTLIDEITQSYRELGDERSLARTMSVRANLMAADGHIVEAHEIMQEAVKRYRALDDLSFEMQAVGGLALAGLRFGDREASARWFPVGVTLLHEFGDNAAVAVGLPMLAIAALEFVGPIAAATLLGAYDEMCRRYGTRMPVGLEQGVAMFSPRERAQALLDPAAFDAAVEAGAAMSLDEVMAYLDATVGQIRSSEAEPA